MRFNISLVLAFVLSLAKLGSCLPTENQKRDIYLKFPYESTKVRGVNLGGWFVLESWIRPSLFAPLNGAAVDEWTFCATLGPQEAYNRLSQHWNSWITQSDFQAIAAAGMNHVRIPIGYWSVIPNYGEPYVQGAYEVLGQALNWAQAAGLKVMIDLHGAPGSQNGFDNSGRYGAIGWTQGNTVNQTLNVLNKIRDDYANHPAVAAIELLNEPFGPSLDMSVTRQFYMDGWGNLENSPVAITFHDAFQPPASWNSWGSGMWNLLEDTHHYEIFDQSQVSQSPSSHISSACAFGAQMAGSSHLTISGEWSGAMTDCTLWLNGYGKGARYDGTLSGSSYVGSCDGFKTGSVAQLTAQQQQDMTKFVEAQMDAFEAKEGWIFWTWKTEGAPGWDMQDMLSNGIFQRPVTGRKYPGQCY